MTREETQTAVDIQEMLADDLRAVDAMMGETLDSLASPAGIDESYRYALFNGGKRVRPILCILSCEALCDDRPPCYPAAAAVEMIHAFSLVHDDLPALDNDDLRRGKPTLHKAKGEAMAILAGDGLLTHAFTILSQQHVAHGEYSLTGLLCAELAQGTGAMINGQIYDTLGGLPEGMPDGEKLRTIHDNKTGALITAACRMGALAAMWPEVNHSHLEALTRYGRAMGLMFQAVDDLLDVESTPAELGKATQKDADAGKLTYPGVFGIDGTRGQIARLRDEATEAIDGLEESGNHLRAFCRTLAQRVT